MYEFDHMLNGRGSRQHLQQMIRQAQHERFAHNVKPSQAKRNAITVVRAVLVALINLVTR